MITTTQQVKFLIKIQDLNLGSSFYQLDDLPTVLLKRIGKSGVILMHRRYIFATKLGVWCRAGLSNLNELRAARLSVRS